MERLGILGGTFDPVHHGHLRPAVEVRAALDLDAVWLMPCRVSPHRSEPHASGAQRLALLRAATADADDLAVDAREIEREGPSYTVDTLASIAAERPAARLYLIIGGDSVQAFERWHRWRDILAYAHLIVATRPEWPDTLPPGLQPYAVASRQELEQSSAGGVWVEAVTPLAVSATALRRLAAAGGDLRFLTPPTVQELIREHSLYQQPENATSDGDRTAR